MNVFRPGQKFDLLRYQGTWYEIGKYPMPFEFGCSGAMAQYKFNPERNGIEVLNTCLVDGLPSRQDTGFATVTDISGEFLLKFDRVPFTSIYRVLETDYDHYSFVGKNTSPRYYYILSRNPKVTQDEINAFFSKTIELGFDPSRVEINPDAL